MYNFASDYLEGAHPQVMEALNKTNFIQTVGYAEEIIIIFVCVPPTKK